jgi:hypothetical protein
MVFGLKPPPNRHPDPRSPIAFDLLRDPRIEQSDPGSELRRVTTEKPIDLTDVSR